MLLKKRNLYLKESLTSQNYYSTAWVVIFYIIKKTEFSHFYYGETFISFDKICKNFYYFIHCVRKTFSYLKCVGLEKIFYKIHWNISAA